MVLGDDDISAPCDCLSERSALDFPNALVDREGHAVTGDGWVKDDIGSSELFVHAVERLDELGLGSE